MTPTLAAIAGDGRVTVSEAVASTRSFGRAVYAVVLVAGVNRALAHEGSPVAALTVRTWGAVPTPSRAIVLGAVEINRSPVPLMVASAPLPQTGSSEPPICSSWYCAPRARFDGVDEALAMRMSPVFDRKCAGSASSARAVSAATAGSVPHVGSPEETTSTLPLLAVDPARRASVFGADE